MVESSGRAPNSTFDRTAGSHLLAAAGQRERSADNCPRSGMEESAHGKSAREPFDEAMRLGMSYVSGGRL